MNSLFSKRLKSLRKEIGKTQDEMSKALKIQRSTYGEYERGRIMPSTDRIKDLADFFGVSTDYLWGKTNFTTHEEKASTISATDVIDVSSIMKLMLDQLKNNNASLKFEGVELDDTSREMLISNIENSMKMAKMLIKNDK